MKRCISALAATLLLALAGGVANAYADSGPGGQVGQTLGQPSQSATQSASNTSGDTSQSFENGGGEITNVGLNNNTVQAGGEPSRPPVLGPESTESSGGASNQSNNNTNTAGNTTAVIGNNDQQTNTQGLSQNQTQNQQGSGGSCCKKNDVDQNQRSSQTASNRDGDTRQKFENGGGEITNVGLNNNTVQKGESAKALPTFTDGGGSNGGNQSNGNTNTAGDTTAVIGNNHQQTNTQGSSQNQSSRGGCCEHKQDGKDGYGRTGSCGCDSPKHDGSSSQRQSSSQHASNRDGNTRQKFENGGGVITNIGLNNNTVQVGSGNESNGNTNTAGGTTAVIGNNDQQSNTQGSSQRQSSSGGGGGDQSQWSGQSARNTDGSDGKWSPCGCERKKAEDGQFFKNGGGEIINVGANNNTVQIGDHNESNGNTNTAGDTTAVIGNNHQQTNTQGSSQSQSSGGGSCGCGSPKYGGSPDQQQSAGQWASNNSGSQPKHESCGCDKPRYEPCGCEKKKTEGGQSFENGGGVITNIGLNNNTVQVGSGNESNNNTNTAGGTTAVIGNNDQQSNTQGSSQNQSSGGSCCHKPDGKDGYGRSNSCGCGSPKHESSPDQRQSAGQWASNSSGDTRQKFEKGGGEIINVGANNNTVQIGDHNESNGNTNTAGDTTAVIGNNHQQTNTQGSSESQSSGGGSCGCGSPKYGGSPDQRQSAGQWASNNSGSQPKHESCGCDKPRYEPCGCEKKKTEGGQSFENGGGVITNIGLNNNTVQVGSGNESNNNTNTAGGTTAVIGNNDQQSNTQGSSQNQSSGGSCCHKPDGKDGYGRSNSCGCGSPKHESSPDQRQSAGQWASNSSGDTRQKFEKGGGEIINVGANNNTVQIGDHNESNGNTNTAGDTTAVIGNNHQQTNTQG